MPLRHLLFNDVFTGDLHMKLAEIRSRARPAIEYLRRVHIIVFGAVMLLVMGGGILRIPHLRTLNSLGPAMMMYVGALFVYFGLIGKKGQFRLGDDGEFGEMPTWAGKILTIGIGLGVFVGGLKALSR
jgi:hypothetical protein